MKYCITLLFVSLLGTSYGQQVVPTNINDFIFDCTRSKGNGITGQMAIWFPPEFWRIANTQNKNIPPSILQSIVTEMEDYMMFSVVDYTITGTEVHFTDEDEIKRNIRLIDTSNTIYIPLNEEDLSPTARELLTSFKPTMSQMLGQFGEGMQIVLFKAKKINGKPSIELTRKNSFVLDLAQQRFKWTIPFASMLAPKYCPIDKETMKGNWDFCPEHGVKLEK